MHAFPSLNNVYGIGLVIERSQVQLTAIPPSGNDSG